MVATGPQKCQNFLFWISFISCLSQELKKAYFWLKNEKYGLTLIPVSFFPTYSPWHALVTRYLNKMKQIVTVFLAWSLPDSVAKRITRQTSDRKDCGSNSPGGECIYNSNQKEDGREKYNMVILDPFYLNGLKFGSKKFIYIKKGIKYIKNESLKL